MLAAITILFLCCYKLENALTFSFLIPFIVTYIEFNNNKTVLGLYYREGALKELCQ